MRVIAAFLLIIASFAAEAKRPLATYALLTVNVSGIAETAPDEAIVRFGIHADGATAAEAGAAVLPRAQRLIALLKQSGVTERELAVGPVVNEPVREEWIENDDLVEGNIVAQRTSVNGTLSLRDMRRAQRIVDLLARQGIEVTFVVEYRLSDELQAKETLRAQATAVKLARDTAISVAKQHGWRLLEMLPPRPQLPADGNADLGGAGPENREWGERTVLSPAPIETASYLIATFRLVP